MNYTVINLNNEGRSVALHTEDKFYHISGAFRINSAMLSDFLETNGEAFYDFDLNYALRLYRISDGSVAAHLTWRHGHGIPAITPTPRVSSCLLPSSSVCLPVKPSTLLWTASSASMIPMSQTSICSWIVRASSKPAASEEGSIWKSI